MHKVVCIQEVKNDGKLSNVTPKSASGGLSIMRGSNYGALKGKFWCLDKRSLKEGLVT